MKKAHSFHIPIMGLGFTIDTPLKVSQFGIDSVVSLVDDILMEKMRKIICEKSDIEYKEIPKKSDDSRANRITSYLNLMNDLAKKKFEEFKTAAIEKKDEVKEYFNLLPDNSEFKDKFNEFSNKYFDSEEIKKWFKDNVSMGSIDVNIMTKLDKENFKNGEKLPKEYNDAHAALRGFAQSKLESSIVFSAGMNPSLYSYISKFDDFFPNKFGEIKKKIILKVSDYRSALIQGKFLAKKGLWVSEFRIESGVNCGGHAFASDGNLIGPILEEFKNKKDKLINSIHKSFVKGMEKLDISLPEENLPVKITAQGGVGTNEEHQFLLEQYNIDSVGWGSPFLLVPEVIAIDDETVQKLADAKEKDLYLSNISPLGVLFNNLYGNTKDVEKQQFIEEGTPGSTCPKEYAKLFKDFGDKGLCTASREYQFLKIKELKEKNLPQEEYNSEYDKVVDKSCICVGLANSALKANNAEDLREGEGISVCPGPNLAYFSEKMTFKNIVDHIYGRDNFISRSDRPNFFIKELDIYLDTLKNKIEETKKSFDEKQKKNLLKFVKNLDNGIEYYNNLFSDLKDRFQETRSTIMKDLDESQKTLSQLFEKIESLSFTK